eukprot:scaffold2687_cov70-Cylindrotheca_fusiformis.AAC.2
MVAAVMACLSGTSAISNHPVAGSHIVIASNVSSRSSFVVTEYGPIISTHIVSHVLNMLLHIICQAWPHKVLANRSFGSRLPWMLQHNVVPFEDSFP